MGGYTSTHNISPFNDPNYNAHSNDAAGPWTPGTSGLYPTTVPSPANNMFPTAPVVPTVAAAPSVGNVVTPNNGSNNSPFNAPLTNSPFQHGVETGSTGYVSMGGRDTFRAADGSIIKNGVRLTDANGNYINSGDVINAANRPNGGNMGSTFVPTSPMNPNMSSLTGNPVYDKETMNKLSTIVPGNPTGQFGNTTQGNPLAPNPTPAAPQPVMPFAPIAAPATPQGGNPNVFTNPVAPTNQPTTAFGYNTNPAAVPGAVAGQIPTPDPKLLGQLNDTYGEGFGQSIYKVLSQGAGFNQGVVNSFMQDIQPYFQDNLNQILESFGASGQRFSSTAALAAGKFGADFTSHQQALMAQMYQWAFENYTRTLTGVGTKDTGSNTFGTISDILSLVKSGSNAAQAGGVGDNGGVVGGILDALSHI